MMMMMMVDDVVCRYCHLILSLLLITILVQHVVVDASLRRIHR